MHTKHTPIYEDDDVLVSLEYVNGMNLIHCTVVNWSKSVYKKLIHVFAAIKEELNTTIYAPVVDSKVAKFAELFGFVYTDSYAYYTDNKIRRIMVCPKQPY